MSEVLAPVDSCSLLILVVDKGDLGVFTTIYLLSSWELIIWVWRLLILMLPAHIASPLYLDNGPEGDYLVRAEVLRRVLM